MQFTRKTMCNQCLLALYAFLLSPIDCLALPSAGCDREDEDACSATVDLLQRSTVIKAHQERQSSRRDTTETTRIAQSFASSASLGEKGLPDLMRQMVNQRDTGLHLLQVPLPRSVQNRSEDLPALTPSPAALVAVCASSVNPSDWFMLKDEGRRVYEEKYGGGFTPRKNMGLGEDVAGVIIALDDAPECEHWHVGQRIWGWMGPYLGAYADYALLDCTKIGPQPHAISHVEAAVIPESALSSLQALRWSGAPWSHPGPVVLILGGSGGTGHTGIQIAKAMGAGRVLTTCSPRNFGFVLEMGADQAIDYHVKNWWLDLPHHSVDIILNCALTSELTADLAVSSQLIKPNGSYVTLHEGLSANATGINQHFFILDQHSTHEMEILRGMVEAGQLRAAVMERFALNRVPDAIEVVKENHVTGKVSISPINEEDICFNENAHRSLPPTQPGSPSSALRQRNWIAIMIPVLFVILNQVISHDDQEAVAV